MPTIHDQPPQAVRGELDALAQALDATVPEKRDGENLLIATWNIRGFGSLTRKWTASGGDSPKRDLRGLRAIIEVVSRFDVIAVQEVMGDLRALRDMMNYLGPDWGFLMTDITLGSAGNRERMAYVFDRRRVRPSGLACELVVPPEWLSEVAEDALDRQFARTPYAVSFVAGESTFILACMHVDYGTATGRIPELRAIARWMADWARRENRWHHNLLLMGDFNIDRQGSPLWQAFTSTGLTVPQDLVNLPRTIFADPARPTLESYYDQIAWFETGSSRRLTMEYLGGGNFDFLPYLYRNMNLSKTSRSWRISDHYPLWVEFDIS